MNRPDTLLFCALSHAAYAARGLNVASRLRWLRQTMDWPAATRANWRLKQLGDILQFAWDQVPFYREYWGDHGVSFRRPRDLSELERFPVLTKAIFRANCHRIVPSSLASIRHMKKHTGGTTGKPTHYRLDLDHWATMQAFHIWGWTQTGFNWGEPAAIIAGGSLLPGNVSIQTRVRNFVERRLFLFGVEMNKERAVDYYRRLQAQGARLLYGYPSVLYVFAQRLREQGLRLPKLRAVITTAEMLQPRYRTGIQEGLGCPVYDNLGSNDGGFESYECSHHRGFHYNDLQSVLETDNVEAGGRGRLLITNLWNRSTPFVRFENGDMVKLAEHPCPCGCGFPIIESVDGRTTDILTFENGRSLAGPALTLIFAPFEIEGWQVVQTARNRLEVRMSSLEELKREDTARVREVLGHYVGPGVEISIRRVDRLDTTSAGKLKPVWSEVPENA